MLSFRNNSKSFSFLSTPLVFFILILITCLRIYSLYTSPIELSVDEAQYWDWSRNIEFGYFTKPPIIAWVIALSTTIFGNEEWAVRLCSPLIHLFIAASLWGASYIAFGARAGKIAALIYQISSDSRSKSQAAEVEQLCESISMRLLLKYGQFVN